MLKSRAYTNLTRTALLTSPPACQPHTSVLLGSMLRRRLIMIVSAGRVVPCSATLDADVWAKRAELDTALVGDDMLNRRRPVGSDHHGGRGVGNDVGSWGEWH
jgi:hypothetical protein